MERWALVSGLGGDLKLYERIQRDLKSRRDVNNLFVLGDLIGPNHSCNPLLERLRQPKRGDLKPDCIYGWWEEQLLCECGYRGDRRADALRLGQGELQLMPCSKPSTPTISAGSQGFSLASSNWIAPDPRQLS